MGILYKTLKKIIFLFPPETAHHLSLSLLKKTSHHLLHKIPHKPVQALGLTFKNPIGLAA